MRMFVDKKLQLQIRLDMRTRQTLAFPVNYRNTAVPPKTVVILFPGLVSVTIQIGIQIG